MNTISSSIASILHKRGLDVDAAKDISNNFTDDDNLFDLMIKNLENGCAILRKEEILEYLSTVALYRKNIDLTSYSCLFDMVYKVKQKPLNKKTLKQLDNIARKNNSIVSNLKKRSKDFSIWTR